MFDIRCPHCQRRTLATTGQIVALVNTDAGPVATVRCPREHLVEHAFRTGTTTALAGDTSFAA